MSCQENDVIWEKIYERAEEGGLASDPFAEMDFETAYNYLITGEVPDCYERIAYRMFKC